MREILRAYASLADRLGPQRALSALALSNEDGMFLWQEDGRIWDAETGQAQLDFRPPQQAAEASDCLPSAIVESCNPIEEWPQEEVADWNQIGLELEARNRPLDAAYSYVEAIRREPRHVNALVNLGRVHQLQNNLWVARELYERAIGIQGNHYIAQYNLGTVYDEVGELDQAIVCYQKARGVADAHFNLGLIYTSRGDVVASRRHQKLYRELSDLEGGEPSN